ncbi:MAG: hypothetical protein AVDCRST_MAG93-4677, partial [uncultured Chloroflexia bacterium]
LLLALAGEIYAGVIVGVVEVGSAKLRQRRLLLAGMKAAVGGVLALVVLRREHGPAGGGPVEFGHVGPVDFDFAGLFAEIGARRYRRSELHHLGTLLGVLFHHPRYELGVVLWHVALLLREP